MDGIVQALSGLTAVSLAISLVALLVLYLVIRLAVMHALRDYELWKERRLKKLARTSYPNAQAYPPISPEPRDPI